MSLKDLFLIFNKSDYEKDLKKKLTSLELNIEELKKSLQTLQQQSPHEEIGKTKDPPIIIEKINIEKIILDKYELNNNFGQLGIKELKGKLNIGATYGSEYQPNFEDEGEGEQQQKNNFKRSTPSQKGPKINFQSNKKD
ncbi:hypothetical protein [Neobacillus sp. PS2-9]|uniref:hypothetical protein n=1 Tax=Neobacillus sp. PS2-9 TaxID=3070676 RepID=UPI0027E1767C|nr:hypothetical protein [Neobacillus sp. PS2-9]WML60143.1 hypothetical protein RCG25_10340 [Neobacillus sp. PS2-9]